MRKFLSVCLSLVLATTLAACGTSAEKANEAITVRVGNVYNENTTYGKAWMKIKEDIEKSSNGEIKLEVFHGNELGSEKDQIESLKAGSLEMMSTGTAGIGLFVPESAVFELWYSYKDVNQTVKVFNSLTPELDKMYQEKGFKLLGAFYDGPRNILSKKKIESIDQLQGLKLRVPGSELYVKMANALGAKAVSMPLGDVYTGLQTGAIDAMEGTPDSIYQAKFYEQSKFYIDDRHVFHPLSIIYNKQAWDQLSDEHKKIIEDAVKKGSKYHMSLSAKANEDALKAMKEAGVQIVTLKDPENWKKAVEQANADFAKQNGEKGEMILNKMKEVLGQ